MGLYEKIAILGSSAQYDTCGPKDFGQTTDIPGVYHAKFGSHICRLFKVLQTNTCHHHCRYCAFRQERDCRRSSATPEEMAKAFQSAYSRRLVEGLFLSSGISGTPDATMTKMIDTVDILRNKYHYGGYIHLKVMPSSSAGCIREAAKLANRISLNIESPTEAGLARLSPDKNLKSGFFYTLSLIKKELFKFRLAGKRTPSVTTQFVVGAADEKDAEIIKMTHFLYKNFFLKRVFYSAFRPVPQTPLSEKPAVPLSREHRLYQTDFLMRFYRFLPWEIPLDQNGFLPESGDPKFLWAKLNPRFFPINLNLADYWQLLRVPGVGPTAAERIIKLRKQNRIRSFSQLANSRFRIKKLSAFACL